MALYPIPFTHSSDLIKEWLGEVEVSGFASFILASKLKYIKEKLKIWNREIFGDIKFQKLKLLRLINYLNMKEESSGLSSDELLQRTNAKAD